MKKRYHAEILAAYIRRISVEQVWSLLQAKERCSFEQNLGNGGSQARADKLLKASIADAINSLIDSDLDLIEYAVNHVIAKDDLEVAR